LDCLCRRAYGCSWRTSLHTIPIRCRTCYTSRIHWLENSLQEPFPHTHRLRYSFSENRPAKYCKDAFPLASIHRPTGNVSAPDRLGPRAPIPLRSANAHRPTHNRPSHHSTTHEQPDAPDDRRHLNQALPDDSMSLPRQPTTTAYAALPAPRPAAPPPPHTYTTHITPTP